MTDDGYASLFEGADTTALFPKEIGAVLRDLAHPMPLAEQDGPPWTHHFPPSSEERNA